jgi:hypothetical protein
MSDPTPEQLQQEFVESEERTSEHLRATQEVRQQRADICATCEFKTTMFTLDACSECNCLLGFKIFLTTADCPKGKW